MLLCSRADLSEGVNGVDKAGQSGCFTHGDHLTDHGAFGKHKTCFDKVANPHIDGHRFSGERRFVERTLSFDDATVGGNEFPASDFDGISGRMRSMGTVSVSGIASCGGAREGPF